MKVSNVGQIRLSNAGPSPPFAPFLRWAAAATRARLGSLREGAQDKRDDSLKTVWKANHGGRWFAVEEVCGNGFPYIVSETFPVIGLGKYGFAQTFSDESAVGLLRYLEHDFVHGLRVCHSWRINKRSSSCDFVKTLYPHIRR